MHKLFLGYLKTKGLKVTEQRNTILKVFMGVKSHISAEELYARIKKQDPTIGQATVFRVMKLLTEAGIAQSSGLGERGVRYELKLAHHDHIICTSCGTVVEFVIDAVEDAQQKIALRHGFTLSDHRMELYGLCRACRQRKEAETPITVADLDNGTAFRVKRVTLAREIGKRLADMGFVRGADGCVVRSALLGDPLQIKICHYDVSLRRSEAKGIEVERVERSSKPKASPKM